MSYISVGLTALIVGLIALAVLIGSILILFAIILLAYGLGETVPGTRPGRCGKWGHDFRGQIPGMPAGKTCRNCLVRKDRAVLAWRRSVPAGVPTLPLGWAPLNIPINAAHEHIGIAPPAVYLVEESGAPRIAVTPGAPLVLPALSARPSMAAVPVYSGDLPHPRVPTPDETPRVAARIVLPAAAPAGPAPRPSPAPEVLCRECFALIPRGAAACPLCRAARP